MKKLFAAFILSLLITCSFVLQPRNVYAWTTNPLPQCTGIDPSYDYKAAVNGIYTTKQAMWQQYHQGTDPLVVGKLNTTYLNGLGLNYKVTVIWAFSNDQAGSPNKITFRTSSTDHFIRAQGRYISTTYPAIIYYNLKTDGTAESSNETVASFDITNLTCIFKTENVTYDASYTGANYNAYPQEATTTTTDLSSVQKISALIVTLVSFLIIYAMRFRT